MNSVLTTTLKCNQCGEMFTMYTESTPSQPWCPHCGYSEREVEEIKVEDTSFVKSETHTEYEDSLTEMNCKDGGWWNPITKKCMGEGNGFIPRK